MKPVILTTVRNRFAELDKTIDSIHAQASEFSEPPAIIIVWACPEIRHFWFFQELRSSGRVTEVLGRPKLDGEREGCATTFYESRNLAEGFFYIRDRFGPDCYILGQCADVRARPGVYRKIDAHMHEGAKAVLFHWENGMVGEDVWHTNFFAVGMDERYWPPLPVSPEHDDTLERIWGKSLAKAELPAIVRWHNSRGLQFEHKHETEGLPPWPEKAQHHWGACSLYIRGHKSWWRRLGEWLGVLPR